MGGCRALALDQLRSDEHGIAACNKALRIWEARLRGRFWGLPLLVVLGLVLGFGFRVFFSPAMQSLGPPSCATRRSQTAKPQAFCTVSVLWDTFTPPFAAFTTRKTKTNALQSPLGRCWSHVFSARMRPCLGHGSRGGGGGRRGHLQPGGARPRESKSTVAWINDLSADKRMERARACATERADGFFGSGPQDPQGLGLAGASRHGQRHTAVEERIPELLPAPHATLHKRGRSRRLVADQEHRTASDILSGAELLRRDNARVK